MIAQKQTQGYYDKIAEVLFDPTANKSIDEAFNFMNTFQYGATQTGVRGVTEGTEALTEEDVPYRGGQREEYLENLQSSLMQPQSPMLDVDMFEPLPSLDMGTTQFAMSPTIVPSESDREIAMRQMQKRGLGSLV